MSAHISQTDRKRIKRGERVGMVGGAFEAVHICTGQEPESTLPEETGCITPAPVLLCIKEIRQRTEATGKGLWAKDI